MPFLGGFFSYVIVNLWYMFSFMWSCVWYLWWNESLPGTTYVSVKTNWEKKYFVVRKEKQFIVRNKER